MDGKALDEAMENEGVRKLTEKVICHLSFFLLLDYFYICERVCGVSLKPKKHFMQMGLGHSSA